MRDKVAQMIMIPCYGESPSARSAAYREFLHQVRDLKVGGIIVINRVVGGSVRNAEPHAMASFLNRMQKAAKVPLLVGGDFERGASMRVSGTVRYPHLMAYGAARDPQLTRQLGLATAREARALGVQWVFAPDADVNNNPDNPIINIRSFGEDPKEVALHVRAFVEGAQSDPKNRVLLTAKHFPGHGDTSVDSHIGLPVLTATRERLDSIEFVPFRAAIDAGVDSVMSAHMAAPALGTGDSPSTTARSVLTGVLRNEMRFNGLVVTDAMDMGGLVKQMPGGDAAVRAVEAGADVLLMPPNAEVAINAVVAAVMSGRIPRKQIDNSVARILAGKVRVGLHKQKLVDLENITDVLEAPDLAEQAQVAADRAITLVKNDRNSVPLANPDASCLFVLSESRYGQQGRKLVEEARARAKNMRTVLFDPQVAIDELDRTLSESMTGCEVNVIAAFGTTSAYKGTVSMSGNYPEIVKKLMDQPAPTVLVSLGNPYLLRGLPQAASYLASFSPVPTSETAVVKALFGEIAIGGKLPVSIPGIAKVGDGIAIQKR